MKATGQDPPTWRC